MIQLLVEAADNSLGDDSWSHFVGPSDASVLLTSLARSYVYFCTERLAFGAFLKSMRN